MVQRWHGFYTPPQYPDPGPRNPPACPMPYTVEEKKSAVRRLRRIAGQAQALERAVEEGCECGAALQQLAALRGAVQSLMAEVLESHLKETFGRAAASRSATPLEVDETIDKTVSLLRSYLK